MATKCDIIYIVHQFPGLVLAYFLVAQVFCLSSEIAIFVYMCDGPSISDTHSTDCMCICDGPLTVSVNCQG